MKFYILASLILFGAVIVRAARMSRRRKENADRQFWEREEAANRVRRKSLDGLPYIRIPWEELPCELPTDRAELREIFATLRTLATRPIVNLTGYTNTDLKLEYGAPNLTLLSEYDANYTLLACTLEKWARLLLEDHREQDAVQVMEFAVSTMTDVRQTYFRLADYYLSCHESEKLSALLETARALRSSNRQAILSYLEQRTP